jgi:mxaJ protein
MYSRFLSLAAFILLCSCAPLNDDSVIVEKRYVRMPKQDKIPSSETALRVCADPNNLPFSNEKREGFENKIADVIGKSMGRPVEYTWWAQRRGFFRSTLRAGVCDVVIGVPASFELAATTRPYYRSTYVFVTKRDRSLTISSLDDPALKNLKIGVQLVGDDGSNAPPAHALASRGIVENVRGYTLYGDYSETSPPARIIDAVEKGEIDVAIAWGPLAGFYSRRAKSPLEIVPVTPEIDLPYLPFVYDIAVGVRRGEEALRDRINAVLVERREEIERILDDYGVPRAADRKEGV